MPGTDGTFKRARAGLLLDIGLDNLIESLRRARRRAWLTSPFLSTSVAELIAEAVEFSGAGDLRLITALGADPVRRGALSLNGLELLHAAGFELRSAPNLHAKAAVVDDGWGLAGSGNLTVPGLGARSASNIELGVVLSRPQVSAAARYFRNWWHSATPILESDLASYRRWAPKSGSRGSRGKDLGPVHGTRIPTLRGRELSRLRDERAPWQGE